MDIDELEALGVALADPTRIQVLAAIDGHSNVRAIAEEVGVAQSTASYHLRLLSEAGLIELARWGGRTVPRRRQGPWDVLFEDGG